MTRADLVRAFVRSDEEIAREIHDEIVVGTMWLAEDAVEIDVRDGDVVVSGALSGSVDRDLLARLIARVPGVVSVETNLQIA